jgi:hypothetical protein
MSHKYKNETYTIFRLNKIGSEEQLGDVGVDCREIRNLFKKNINEIKQSVSEKGL